MTTIVAVDLAKHVFELAIADRGGRIEARRRLSRGQLERFIARQRPSCFVFETCATAHHWGRVVEAAGHEARLLPARYVRAYRRRGKSDRADATALVEASRASDIDAVALKRPEQQALQHLHRLREQCKDTRRRRICGARAMVREFGIEIPRGAGRLKAALPGLLEEPRLPPLTRELLAEIAEEIGVLERRLAGFDARLERLAGEAPRARRFCQLPGVGAVTATALAAAVGDLGGFRNARAFASWLGLTPREHSSGQRRRLGAITKQGSTYLRTLLIHGARSLLGHARRKASAGRALSPLEAWALALRERSGPNRAAVAVANKLARRLYALERDGADYDPFHDPGLEAAAA